METHPGALGAGLVLPPRRTAPATQHDPPELGLASSMGGGGRGCGIGLVLRSFREGHPGVTGHVAYWARGFDMRTAPLRPGTRSRHPVTTS